jgi:hypothetical protein
MEHSVYTEGCFVLAQRRSIDREAWSLLHRLYRLRRVRRLLWQQLWFLHVRCLSRHLPWVITAASLERKQPAASASRKSVLHS